MNKKTKGGGIPASEWVLVPAEQDSGKPLAGKLYDGIIRVSRENGRGQSGDEWSPDRQKDDVLRRAQSDGFGVRRWVDESASVSGGSVEREGLQRAVTAAEDGETDGLAVAKVDRFARTVQGGLTTIVRLEDAESNLVSAREGMIVGDERATATDKLVRNFYLMLAQWQRDTLAEEWEAMRADSIEKGIHPRESYGYRRGADRRLVPDPAEEAVVLRIATERAGGAAFATIAAGLNADGLKPRQRKRQADDGDHDRLGRRMTAAGWTGGRVREIVSARVYLGWAYSKPYVKKGAHPAIIPTELWDRANGLRQSTGRARAKDYMLTGVARCDSCGYTMAGATRKVNGKPYTYYSCRRSLPGGEVCKAPADIRGIELDAIMEDRFKAMYFSVRLEPVEDDRLAQALAVEDEAREELRDYLTSDTYISLRRSSPDLYREGLRAREVAIADAEIAVNDARNAVLRTSHPVSLADDWDAMSPDDKRGYLADAFDCVAIARTPKLTPTADRIAGVYVRDTAPDRLRVGSRSGKRAVRLVA
jgi:DNA invertase Pin-like site-specific DNA recombinase